MKAIDFNFKCSEKWDNMSPEGLGRHCKSCEKIVIDFTSMSTQEIQAILRTQKNNDLCGRMLDSQIDELNKQYDLWLVQRQQQPQLLFFTALLLAFGLSLFSCSDNKAEEKIITAQHIAINQIALAEENTRALGQPKEAIPASSTKFSKETITVEQELEPVYILQEKDTTFLNDINIDSTKELILHHGYAGGIGYTQSYFEHLISITDSTEYDEQGREIPKVFEAKVYPNPSTGPATLEIKTPLTENCTVRIFDMSGRFIALLHEGELLRGTHELSFDLLTEPSGMYLIQFSSKSKQQVIRIVKN